MSLKDWGKMDEIAIHTFPDAQSIDSVPKRRERTGEGECGGVRNTTQRTTSFPLNQLARCYWLCLTWPKLSQ